jgi:hypothetical protein
MQLGVPVGVGMQSLLPFATGSAALRCYSWWLLLLGQFPNSWTLDRVFSDHRRVVHARSRTPCRVLVLDFGRTRQWRHAWPAPLVRKSSRGIISSPHSWHPCWWKSGPKGGRRHNSPLNSLPTFALSCEVPTSTSTWAKKGNAETYEDGTRKILCKPKTEELAKGLRCSLLITGCPFHYKGFTIYRRPLGIVICLNYTFSVPDKPL